MTYSIRIEKDALKQLRKIKKPERVQIVKAIEKLKYGSAQGKMLSGKWKGLSRMRSGDYRIIYGVRNSELLILVVRIAHRKEVYR